MGIDRKKFFAGIRHGPFPGKLLAKQVEGVNVTLDAWEKQNYTKDLRHLAYMLATKYHETGHSMQPVMETRQLSEAKNPTVDVAIARLESSWKRGRMPWVKKPYWRKNARGLSYLGRGDVQLTHEYNYKRMGEILGIDLVNNPDLALDPAIATNIMFEGMLTAKSFKGDFTNHHLGEYFNATKNDPVNARRIINGLDKAKELAIIYKQFYADLVEAST